MSNEVIPSAADHVRFISESMIPVWHYKQVKILVMLDQFIDHHDCCIRVYVIVQRPIHE